MFSDSKPTHIHLKSANIQQWLNISQHIMIYDTNNEEQAVAQQLNFPVDCHCDRLSSKYSHWGYLYLSNHVGEVMYLPDCHCKSLTNALPQHDSLTDT